MERGHPVRLSAQRKSLLIVVNRSLSVLRTLADRDVRAPASTLCIQPLCDKSLHHETKTTVLIINSFASGFFVLLIRNSNRRAADYATGSEKTNNNALRTQ